MRTTKLLQCSRAKYFSLPANTEDKEQDHQWTLYTRTAPRHVSVKHQTETVFLIQALRLNTADCRMYLRRGWDSVINIDIVMLMNLKQPISVKVGVDPNIQVFSLSLLYNAMLYILPPTVA